MTGWFWGSGLASGPRRGYPEAAGVSGLVGRAGRAGRAGGPGRPGRAGRRRGVTLLEVMVGMAILAVGLLPYLDLLRGARGLLSESGDILALENRCLQALSEARSMVVQGRIGQVPPDGEEVLQASEDGVRYSVTVTRLAGDRAFKLMARAESEDRFFQVSRVVADPITSFYTPIPGAGGPP